MKSHMARKSWTALLLTTAIATGSAFGAGGNPLSFGKPDFEFTGTVYDNATKQPIEGAYVVAIYREQVVSMAAMNSWCVKTRGMYTGKDGKFHFPVENLKGNSPLYAGAIKPGYFNGPWEFPAEQVWKRQGKEAYSNRDIFLNPQDPKNPKFAFGTGEEFCSQAKLKPDAAAGANFLRLQLQEYQRLGVRGSGIDAVTRMIATLDGLPETPASK